MPNSSDPQNPLRSALNSLKSRIGSEKETTPKEDWAQGVLSGDDYPELELLTSKKKPETKPPPGTEFQGENLQELVQKGSLRKLDAAGMSVFFASVLDGGLLELFVRAIDRVRAALESTAPDDRRWGLESVRALIHLEDLSLVPYGTLPLLLDCVGRVLVKEERVELRDAALEISSRLLGCEASRGELESLHSHLAWLERTAKGRGQEYSSRIMASRELASPVLERLFNEGHAVLESAVLPFFRFAGEQGARSLVVLLEEEQNRQHRSRILDLLKLLGPLSIPALKEGLVAGSWHLVRNALNLVGELEEPQAFEYVVPCLDHGDVRVVQAAIRALWKTGGPRAEPYLLELLPRAEPELQLEVLRALELAGSREAIPVLGSLARSAAEAVRIKVLEVLGQLKDVGALPVLEAQLKRKGRIFKTSEPMPVRLAAARALLIIGTRDARRILEQAVADEPKGPAQEALRAVLGA